MNLAMRTHVCPGPGCKALVTPSRLMCRTHWFQVPKPLRDDLFSAVDAYKATSVELTNDAEFKALRRKMQLAQVACIAAVRGQVTA